MSENLNSDVDLDSMGIDPASGTATGTNANPSGIDEVINATLTGGGQPVVSVPGGARRAASATQALGDSQSGMVVLLVVVLVVFLGHELTRRTPGTMRAASLAAMNAIGGVIAVGALLVLSRSSSTLGVLLGVTAAALGVAIAVGGYLVTDRMLLAASGKGEEGR